MTQAQIGPRPTGTVDIQPKELTRKKDMPFGMNKTPHNPAQGAKNISKGGNHSK
jgi:hypothetical protein